MLVSFGFAQRAAIEFTNVAQEGLLFLFTPVSRCIQRRPKKCLTRLQSARVQRRVLNNGAEAGCLIYLTAGRSAPECFINGPLLPLGKMVDESVRAWHN